MPNGQDMVSVYLFTRDFGSTEEEIKKKGGVD